MSIVFQKGNPKRYKDEGEAKRTAGLKRRLEF